MITEIGHFLLIVGVLLAIAQSSIGLLAHQEHGRFSLLVTRYLAISQAVLLTISFTLLVHAFWVSDFSVSLVHAHSHTLQPAIYKFTSVWGNHEGSIFLWILILALFSGSVAWFGRNLPAILLGRVLAVMGMISAAMGAFVVLTSNPFSRLDPTPLEGRDLNPILQDVGLAIHPPLLYVGYVGFSVCFAFALAALISGKVDAAWARWVRPWTLVSWVFLTLGIAMGSYWAYYELGWGGWWFWDPVENAALMPWIAGTALLHSAVVMEKREALKSWTVFLAIVTFALSLLGTFLVRSGVLTSVHTFAADPGRGLFILVILIAFIAGGFVLFALRAASLQSGGLFAPISREGLLVLNNLFLLVTTAAILTGTLYPLVLEGLTGDKISVGAPFFNYVGGLLMLPLLLLVPFGPLMGWKRGDLAAVGARLMWVAVLAVLTVLIGYGLVQEGPWLAPIGFGLGVWLIFGALADIVERIRFGRITPLQSLYRLIGLPKIVFATFLAHAGIGVMVLGIVSTTAFETENITQLGVGETLEVGGHTLRYDGRTQGQVDNYVSVKGLFTLIDARDNESVMIPERRIYTAQRSPTSEAAIKTVGFSQIYIAMGGVNEDKLVVRAWYKPYILLIWLGAVIMSIGGLISLSVRGIRVGAPSRLKKQVANV